MVGLDSGVGDGSISFVRAPTWVLDMDLGQLGWPKVVSGDGKLGFL